MNKQQYKICKLILKQPKLTKITKKLNLDYIELQEKFDNYMLNFSDNNFDENTHIYITDKLMSEYEEYRRNNISLKFSIVIGTVGAITGITSLLLDLMPILM